MLGSVFGTPFRDVLFISLSTIFLVWLLRVLWGRRRLWICAAQVPGPRWIPIIGLNLMYVPSTAYIIELVDRFSDDYGEIFRFWFGPFLVFHTSKPEYLDIILSSPKSLDKTFVVTFFDRLVGKGLLTSPVAMWKHQRKLFQPAFNLRFLERFVEIFTSRTGVLVKRLQGLCDQEIEDLYALMTDVTLEIVSETSMGLKIESDHKFGRFLDRAMELLMKKECSFHYRFEFIYNLTKESKELHKLLAYLDDFVSNIITSRRKEFMENRRHETAQIEEVSKQKKPILDLMFELALQEGSTVTEKDIRDQVYTFLLTGTETSAVTMCFTITLLAMHPEIQQKVYDEIIEVMGPERQVTNEDLSKLLYMERVLKETMRLFPIGAMINRYVNEELQLDERISLPAGCSVNMGILYLQRNAKYWPNPLKFDPDRFLPEEVAKRHPCCFIPFSYGPRGCIGLRYAMMEMKCMLSTILRPYKAFTRYKSVEDIRLNLNILLKPAEGFKITFKPRN